MQEANVLFNNAFDTFYLELYCVGHMVNDHSDSERGNTLLLLHGLLIFFLPISSIITPRLAHSSAFLTPVVEHWLGRGIVQRVHHEGSIRRPIAP